MSLPAYESKLGVSPAIFLERAGEAYGRSFRAVDPPCNGYRSTTIRVRDDAGNELLIKAVDAESRPSLVSLELQAHLADSGVPVVVPIPALSGELCTNLDSVSCLVYPFVAGDGYEQSASGLREAGATLARVHAIDVLDEGLPVVEWGLEKERVCQAFSGSRHPSLESIDLNAFERELGSSSSTLLHTDFRAQNVIFANGQIQAVLDWDGVSVGHRFFDLTYSLLFFGAVLDGSEPRKETVDAFLAGYAVSAPLTDDERADFPVFLHLSLLRGLGLWNVIWVSSDGPTRETVSNWINTYAPLLERLDSLVVV